MNLQIKIPQLNEMLSSLKCVQIIGGSKSLFCGRSNSLCLSLSVLLLLYVSLSRCLFLTVCPVIFLFVYLFTFSLSVFLYVFVCMSVSQFLSMCVCISLPNSSGKNMTFLSSPFLSRNSTNMRFILLPQQVYLLLL